MQLSFYASEDPRKNVSELIGLIDKVKLQGGGEIVFEDKEYDLSCFYDQWEQSHSDPDLRFYKADEVTAEFRDGVPRFKAYEIRLPVMDAQATNNAQPLPPEEFEKFSERHPEAPFLTLRGRSNTGTIIKSWAPIRYPDGLSEVVRSFLDQEFRNVNQTGLDEESNLIDDFITKMRLWLENVDPERLADYPGLTDELNSKKVISGIKHWFASRLVYKNQSLFGLRQYVSERKSHATYFVDLEFDGRQPEFFEMGWRTNNLQFEFTYGIFSGSGKAETEQTQVMTYQCTFNHFASDGLQVYTNTFGTFIKTDSVNCHRGGIVVTGQKNDVYIDGYFAPEYSSTESDMWSLLNFEIERWETNGADRYNRFEINNVRALFVKFLLRSGSWLMAENVHSSYGFRGDFPNSKATLLDCHFSSPRNRMISQFTNHHIGNFGKALFTKCSFTLNPSRSSFADWAEDHPLLAVNIKLDGLAVESDWRLKFEQCEFINDTAEAVKFMVDYNQTGGLGTEPERRFVLDLDECKLSGRCNTGMNLETGHTRLQAPEISELQYELQAFIAGFEGVILPSGFEISGDYTTIGALPLLRVGEFKDSDELIFGDFSLNPLNNTIKIQDAYIEGFVNVVEQIKEGKRVIRSNDFAAPRPSDSGLPGDEWFAERRVNIGLVEWLVWKKFKCIATPNAPGSKLLGTWEEESNNFRFTKVLGIPLQRKK